MFWGGLKCDRNELQNCRNVPNCIFTCPPPPYPNPVVFTWGNNNSTPTTPRPLHPTRCRVDQVPYFPGDLMDVRLMLQSWGAAAAGSGGWILSDGVPEREKNSAAFLPAGISGAASMRHRLASENQTNWSSTDSLTHIIPDALALAARFYERCANGRVNTAFWYSELSGEVQRERQKQVSMFSAYDNLP